MRRSINWSLTSVAFGSTCSRSWNPIFPWQYWRSTTNCSSRGCLIVIGCIWLECVWLAPAKSILRFVIGFPENPSHFHVTSWPWPNHLRIAGSTLKLWLVSQKTRHNSYEKKKINQIGTNESQDSMWLIFFSILICDWFSRKPVTLPSPAQTSGGDWFFQKKWEFSKMLKIKRLCNIRDWFAPGTWTAIWAPLWKLVRSSTGNA